MTRDEAVARINQEIGWRPTGWNKTSAIEAALREAQRNLESGKTLPKFLLVEDATVTLLAGQHATDYPAGFIRISDDTRLRFYPTNSEIPTFLSERFFIDATEGNLQAEDSDTQTVPRAPTIYVLRQGFIDFIITANVNYTIWLDYYKKADLLTTNIENAWLADDAGGEWLIGEAGYRIARSLRDQNAMKAFDEMRTSGRAACFGEILARETQSGPLRMGRNL